MPSLRSTTARLEHLHKNTDLGGMSIQYQYGTRCSGLMSHEFFSEFLFFVTAQPHSDKGLFVVCGRGGWHVRSIPVRHTLFRTDVTFITL